MTDISLYSFAAIAGLAAMTVITRCFFFLSAKDWTLPRWASRGLPYAPIAALSAVVVPELLLTQGHLGNPLVDARTWGAVAGAAWYYLQRRSHNAILGTIIVGMAVYLPLHIGLGW